MLNKYLKRADGEETVRIWTPTIIGTAKPVSTVHERGKVQESLVDYQFVTKCKTNDVFPRGYTQSHRPTAHYANEAELTRVFTSRKNNQQTSSEKVENTAAQNATSQSTPSQKPAAQQVKPANKPEPKVQQSQSVKTNTPKASRPATPDNGQQTAVIDPQTDHMVNPELESEIFGELEQLSGNANIVADANSYDDSQFDTLEDELFADIEEHLNQSPPSSMSM